MGKDKLILAFSSNYKRKTYNISSSEDLNIV